MLVEAVPGGTASFCLGGFHKLILENLRFYGNRVIFV